MVNIRQMVWEPIKYLIIFLIYVMRGKYLRTFRAITKCSHRSFKYPNEESGKIEKKLGCTTVCRTLSNIYDGAFCENTAAKSC